MYNVRLSLGVLIELSFGLFIGTLVHVPVQNTTKTTSKPTISPPRPVNRGNSSVPTNANITGASDVSTTTMTSPCSGCEKVMTTFIQCQEDNSRQSQLSTGE